METRSVKISIPELIEEYLFSRNDSDTEECAEVKNRFNNFYNSCDEPLKEQLQTYITNYINRLKLSNEQDLDGLFDEVFKKKQV